jgi:hypothetical protein
MEISSIRIPARSLAALLGVVAALTTGCHGPGTDVGPLGPHPGVVGASVPDTLVVDHVRFTATHEVVADSLIVRLHARNLSHAPRAFVTDGCVLTVLLWQDGRVLWDELVGKPCQHASLVYRLAPQEQITVRHVVDLDRIPGPLPTTPDVRTLVRVGDQREPVAVVRSRATGS